MPKFDAAWTKKLKIFYLPTLIFVFFFFTISQEVVEKVVYRKKKWGVTHQLRENIASEVNAKATGHICAQKVF